MKKEKIEFSSKCAFAMSLGKDAEGSEKHKVLNNGKTYYFSNSIAKLLWKILPNREKNAEMNYKNKKF